ncbi:MAG: DinB family protein [Vicinamibacterales bacterium]
MAAEEHAEIRALEAALDAVDADARTLIDGLTAEQGVWRPAPGSWSIAHCLDHLATAHRVYLRAMETAAAAALARGSRRRRPAVPGIIGSWFVRSLDAPAFAASPFRLRRGRPVKPRFKMKAPTKIAPRESPSLADAETDFFSSQQQARAFLRQYAEIDLAGVHFPNPFVRGVRFSLATGLHVIAAHDRRHVWQAWNVRHALNQLLTKEADSSAPSGRGTVAYPESRSSSGRRTGNRNR